MRHINPILVILLGLTAFCICTGATYVERTAGSSGLGGVSCSGGATRCFDIAALSDNLKVEEFNASGNGLPPPTVSIGPASSITTDSAILNGHVNPNGFTTNYYFQYGPSVEFGSTTAPTSAGSGTSAVPVAVPISGLTPGVTYRFRLCATNTWGPSCTANASFTTNQAASMPPTQLVFPQFADGGGYRTALLLTNGTSTNTTATVSFYSNSGTPTAVTVGSTTSTFFTVPVQAGGSAKLTTAGAGGSTAVGWILITTVPAVSLNGNAIYQLFSNGSLFSEASVPPAAPANIVEFYADEEGAFNTGFAMTNPCMDTATGTLTLRDADGQVTGMYSISLAPGHHIATFLFQIIAGAASGRAEISLTSGLLSVAALRYHASSVFSTVLANTPGAGSSPISALFSPDGGVRARIIAEIDKAASSIDIAIHTFTSDEIRNALISARNRGVVIRIIADSSQAGQEGGEIPLLESLGFNVKRMSGILGGIMHNKYMIIDRKFLLSGSYNWSVSAEERNFENAVFITGSTVVQDFMADFNQLWSR